LLDKPLDRQPSVLGDFEFYRFTSLLLNDGCAVKDFSSLTKIVRAQANEVARS
jgi:hypothetical protein